MMRRILFAAFAGTSLLASAAVFADDTKPVSPTPAATTDTDKPICKPVMHEGVVVGRACHTQKQWDQMQFRNQQELHDMQQQGLTSAPH